MKMSPKGRQVPKEERVDGNGITRLIVDVQNHIHTVSGPGLLESAYEYVLADELAAGVYEVLIQDSIKTLS
jgi:hypothetical protein